MRSPSKLSKLSLWIATLALAAACSEAPKGTAASAPTAPSTTSARAEPRPVRVAEAEVRLDFRDDDAAVLDGTVTASLPDEPEPVRPQLSPEEAKLLELEAALAEDPTLDAVREQLVRAYLDKNPERARDHAEMLARVRPDDAGVHYALGRTYMKLAMWREAIASFERSLELKPTSTYARNNLGYSALQIGETALALQHLEAILELSPRQPYMLNNLGLAYEKAGRRADAFAAYLRALELSPGYVKAVVNKQRLQPLLSEAEMAVALEVLEALASEPVAGETTAEASVETEGGLAP